MVSIIEIICCGLIIILQLDYIRSYAPPMLHYNAIETFTWEPNYTGTTEIDSIEHYPDVTAMGNLTILEHGTMRREEDLIHAKGYHSGSVIFLHGLGSTGEKMKKALQEIKPDLEFEHIKFVFPTAPLIPYTPANGELKRAWFDKTGKNANSPEREKTLKKIAEDVKEIVRLEMAIGIPLNRIVIGGFSMGGAMAMHLGYKGIPKLSEVYGRLNGVFALSSYLNPNSTLYTTLDLERKKRAQKHPRYPPLFHAHGDKDKVVLHKWGKETFQKLIGYGIEGEFETETKLHHKIRRDEIDALWKWIGKQLPELDLPSDYYDDDYPTTRSTLPPWHEVFK